MKSGQVRDEIVDAIAYNNAPSCAVNFSDEGMGEFLGNKKETFKIGYALQIQFEVNLDDYYFTGFEAVTNDSEKTPLTDSVKFENADTDERNAAKGIYKYNVTILKQSKNILIRPVCKLLPKITQITPKFESSGCDQDTPIQITFNKAVDSASFDPTCISIFADEDLKECFEVPEFSEDKTTINISAKKLILPPDGTKSLLDIEVSYDFSNLKDKDGLPLTAQGTHKYKINKTFGNQKAVMVTVQTEQEYGSIIPSGKKECIVDFTIDVQFTLAKDKKYKFIDFEAVSSTDQKISRADCISIAQDDKDYDEEAGIYKAKIHIIKDKNDILIRPKCLELPAVTSYTPVLSDSANPVNTPIVINFNMPIEAQKIKDNILFSWNGSTMSEYFEEPVLNDQKNILTITPKAIELKDFLKTLSVIDIKISLTSGITVEKEGYILPLKQDSNTSFTVRYNKEIEQDPPEEIEFFVTGYELSLDKVEQFGGVKFAMGNFNVSYNTPDSAKIQQNKCGNSVYIYGCYYDKDSGVKKITVTDKRTNERFNQNAAVDEEEFETIYTKDSDNIEFVSDGTGKIIFCVKHEIVSQEGAVAMSVTVTDSCNNSAETKNFIAIKMSSIELTKDFSVSNTPGGAANNSFSFEEYIDFYKTIRIYKTQNAVVVRDGNYANFKNFTFFCEYTDKNGIERKEQFVSSESASGTFSYTFDVISVKNLSFKILLIDEFGNELTQDFSFPGSVSIKSIEEQPDREDGRYKVQYMSYATTFEIGADNSIVRLEHFFSPGGLNTYGVYCDPNLKYYVINAGKGLLGEPDEFTIKNVEALPQVGIKSLTVSNGNESGYGNITLTLEDDSWQKFEKILFATSSDYHYFETGSLSYTFPRLLNLINSTRISIYGLKGFQPANEKIIEVNNIDIKALDNVPPEFSIIGQKAAESFEAADYYVLHLNDTYKGEVLNKVNYGNVHLGEDDDNGYFYCECEEMESDDPDVIANGLDFKIPIWYLVENFYKEDRIIDSKTVYDNTGLVNFWYNTEDNVENYDEGTKNITLKTLFSFETYDYEGGTSCKIKSRYMYPKLTKDLKVNIFIAKLNTTPSGTVDDERYNNWEAVPECTIKEGIATYNTNKNYYYRQNISVPENSFAKILVQRDDANGGEFANPVYLYTGAKATWNTGTYDYVIANGSSQETVIVSSDAPTFVHVLATSRPFDECKNWSETQWERNHRHFGDKYIDFSNDHSAQVYKIPMDVIYDEDWRCYVVIAYFADGTTAMSEVMQN